VAGRGDDPAGGARRRATLGPASQRGRERLGNGVLGEVDVAERADEDGDGPPVLGAENGRDLVRCHRSLSVRGQRATSWNGRISIGSVVAVAAFRPQASAASRSGAVMTQMPPTYSLPSTYGPSVTMPSARTTVALPGAVRPPVNTHEPPSRNSSLSRSRSARIRASVP